MKLSLLASVYAALQLSLSSALTISEINGHKYLSPYAGQNVTAVKGLVTAKGPRLVFIYNIFQMSIGFLAKNKISRVEVGLLACLKNVTNRTYK
jgi:hypothetical protein